MSIRSSHDYRVLHIYCPLYSFINEDCVIIIQNFNSQPALFYFIISYEWNGWKWVEMARNRWKWVLCVSWISMLQLPTTICYVPTQCHRNVLARIFLASRLQFYFAYTSIKLMHFVLLTIWIDHRIDIVFLSFLEQN